LSLPELLYSFDDDAFRREYLEEFEKEFRELTVKISDAVKKNDQDYFSRIVHKITPNILRIGDNNLASQLSHLKTLMTSERKDIKAIESQLKEIECSCTSICDRIIDIRNEFFSIP